MTTITHARLLRLAGPIILSNATVPLLGAVNMGVIGRLGQAAPIGAVGLGSVILMTIYWIFGFLRMGTSGLAAQARGRGDGAETGAILLRGLFIAGGAGLFFVALQGPIIWAALHLAPATPGVKGFVHAYLAIRIWGAPATIAAYAITGWMIALERSRAVLVMQVATNLINVALCIVFVLHFGWGVPGVAVATLVAEWAGVALGLALCRDALWPVLRPALRRLRDRTALQTMVVVNRDIMIRSVMLQMSFTAFAFIGAYFGDTTLAANQVLLQFLEITAYALDGVAFAAETLVGQAVGAGARAELRRAVSLVMGWGFAGAGVLAVVFAAAGPTIIDQMTTAPDVRDAAHSFLPWLIAAPIIGVASWIYDGIFIGATLTADMRRTMTISVACYGAALAALVPVFGNHGLWAALMLMNLTRGVTMARRFPQAEARLMAQHP